MNLPPLNPSSSHHVMFLLRVVRPHDLFMLRSLSKVTAKLLDKVVVACVHCLLSPMIHRKFRSRWRERETEGGEGSGGGGRGTGNRSEWEFVPLLSSSTCTTPHVSAKSQLLTDSLSGRDCSPLTPPARSLVLLSTGERACGILVDRYGGGEFQKECRKLAEARQRFRQLTSSPSPSPLCWIQQQPHPK